MPGARMSRRGLTARSAACPISSWMVSRMACWLMGSTMPLVPRTLSPPSTPMWGLKVRFAVSAPPSMEMVTSKPPAYPADSASFSSASFIMARGTWLDGSFAHGLVETGLCHPAHALTAVDAHLAGQLGPEGDAGDDRAGRWSRPHRRRRPSGWRTQLPRRTGGRR